MKTNKDAALKALESHNDIFADICNVLIYDGKQIIKPDDLEDASTDSYYKADAKVRSQKRDVAKYWKTGNTLIKIARFGIENQSQTDPDMPFRIIGYDGASYRNQIDYDQPRYPVVTIVIYTGDQEWKSPCSLYEALSPDEEMKRFVSDYKINLFQLSQVTAQQVEKFQSVFQNLADYMYHKTNNLDYHGSTKPLTHTEEFITAMEEITGDKRIGAVYNEIKDEDNKEVNMCTLLDRVEERRSIANAKTMLEDGKLSIEDIAKYSGLPLEKIKELAAEVCVGVTK